jgi:hypothetical protein
MNRRRFNQHLELMQVIVRLQSLSFICSSLTKALLPNPVTECVFSVMMLVVSTKVSFWKTHT